MAATHDLPELFVIGCICAELPFVVALDAPLNDQQLDVLRWIGQGCPQRDWPDAGHKTVAVALQNRRLVTISRKGGRWAAQIQAAGQHYLAHGAYPASHGRRKMPTRSPSTSVANPVTRGDRRSNRTQPAHATGSATADQAAPPGSPAVQRLTPTRQLLHDIVTAGGSLRRNVKDDKTNYGGLVTIINRRGMAPAGQRLVMTSAGSYYDRLFQFEPLPTWRTVPPRELVAAERIGRWHPVVAPLRDNKRLGASSDIRRRMLRILQSIALEAEARGHTVVPPTKHADHRGYQQRNNEPGQLVICIGQYRFAVSVQQRDSYTAHVPTAAELDQQKKWSWSRPPRWDIAPGERLRLRIGSEVFRGRGHDWSDTKSLSTRVEDRLAEAMKGIEDSARCEDERRAAEARARDEEARRRAAAEALAGERHADNMRAVALRDQASAWQQAELLRSYLGAMAVRRDSLETKTRE